MKIGFLPLYIALYDTSCPELRDRLEPFYETLACALEKKGLEVVRSPFCRLDAEFKETVTKFEQADVDCIVTWHAAYSPSLESIKALADTALPIVVLDTTETLDFSPAQDPAEINFCHGIHGVMDMCNMLNRYGKKYAIAAGHYADSDVLDRTVGYVKAAVAARALLHSKVGIIGQSFPGMGDFYISDEEIADRFDIQVVHADGSEIAGLKAAIPEEKIVAEMAADLAGTKKINNFSEESHYLTVKNCLAVRRWLEKYGLDAFTIDFMDICPALGLDVMPFMEACKAMARGIGYAGEGDVLTAALTGALLKGFQTATFVEIFCPDWKNNTLFLSHMGEVNYALIEGKPEFKEMNFIYGEAENPVIGYACYRKGPATFINLFKDADGYKLLIAPVMMEAASEEDRFVGSMRGWMRPEIPVAEFLEKISLAGATHHSALIYDATSDQLAYFGSLLGLEIIRV